jgi:hypothetical protein
MAGGGSAHPGKPSRAAIRPARLERASRLVELAWQDLPKSHRQLLESIGASQWQVVDRPLQTVVDDLLRSAGYASLAARHRAGLEGAAGVWLQDLRIVVIDAGHEALRDLDDSTYEAMMARIAWHEWGHALSLARTAKDDVAAGGHLLGLAPEGIREIVRRSGYGRNEYTHELVAELYVLLMSRRRRGQTGQPPWLADELYRLLRTVSGWND